jgi:hypothetical protein
MRQRLQSSLLYCRVSVFEVRSARAWWDMPAKQEASTMSVVAACVRMFSDQR